MFSLNSEFRRGGLGGERRWGGERRVGKREEGWEERVVGKGRGSGEWSKE